MSIQISVVTAVFNRVHTVGDAIKSVQSQTHGNVQQILVDGASTDGTLALLKDSIGPNAILVSEPDEGIYDALNKGLALATGDVVGVMHSDDYFADDKVLADVADAFADPTVDAVYGDLDYVDASDTSRVVRHWKAGPYVHERLGWGWMPPHPTLFVRRKVTERLGGYDTRYQIAADYDWVLRYLGHARIRVKYVPRVLVKMRAGGESNQSFQKIARKSWEDWLVMRRNKIGAFGGIGSLLWKNISKVRQFSPYHQSQLVARRR
jgi:glycosyltransferase involved in cell wall biosynthesis